QALEDLLFTRAPDVRIALEVLSGLGGADLHNATLVNARLNGADLKGADISYAYLIDADLTAADLTGADLRGSLFGGAVLTAADLTGADLRDAIEPDLRYAMGTPK